MAKRITIQHYYTTGSTAPDVSELSLGEIAMSTAKNNEGIYFKNNAGGVVKVPTITEIQSTIQTAVSDLDGNGFKYKSLSVGDSPKFHIGAGTGISVTEDAVGISPEYQDKINNGVTAYEWGNHADEGYAKNDDLTAHTTNNNIHVTSADKSLWTDAAVRFNVFMSGDTKNEALDTLLEIQEFLSGDTTGTVSLISKVNKNTEDISANTKDIETLKSNQFNYVQDVNNGDNYIIVNPASAGTANKTVLISHNTAQEESSAINATNSASTLNFGGGFTILNKVAYDAKGHVVSGDTQTLTLPTLPTASTDNANKSGVVKLKIGTFDMADELLKEDYLTTAASIAHGHTEYVKLAALSSNNTITGNTITISCGTY